MIKQKQSKATQGGIRASLKWLLPLLVGAFLALSATQARADEIRVQGTTTGSFAGTVDTSSGGLNFAGTGFDQTTAGGNALISLGSFHLGSDVYNYNGSFTLNILFTLPSVLTGNSTFLATVTGTVTHLAGFAVVINFAPAPYTFSNAQYTGSFTLTPIGVSLNTGDTVSLNGLISGGQQTPISTPEPSTLLLSGVGLGGVFLMRRRVWAA